MSEDSILVSCLGSPRAQSLPRLEHKESRPGLSHPWMVQACQLPRCSPGTL